MQADTTIDDTAEAEWRSAWDDPQELEAALDSAEEAALRMAPEEHASLPPELHDWEPGPALAAFLTTVDPHALPRDDRVQALRAYTCLVSHMQAGVYRAIGSIIDAYRELLAEDPEQPVDEEWVWRGAEAEIRAALRLTRRAASSELGLAEALRQRLPRAAQALARGLIDRPRVQVLIRETSHLPDTTAREVTDQVLADIEQGRQLTTGELRRWLRRLAVEIQPQEAAERFTTAHEDRRMVVEPTPDGTADVGIYQLSPEQAMAASDHVDRLARHLKSREGETRTLDQLRADLAAALLAGHAPDVDLPEKTRGGRLEIRVDLATLAGLADNPGELGGYGPVVADIARKVARNATRWEYTVTDPDTGQVVDTGTTRRRPSASEIRTVRAQFPLCIFPGCLMPAHLCDLDHRHPYALGGKTHEQNLGPGCRFDHVNRHHLGWTYQPTPDGDFVWTSPLGIRSTTSGRPP